MLRSLFSNTYRTALHTSIRTINPRPSALPKYRTFTTSYRVKMSSEKADPTTASLPAEQVNPPAPAPKVGEDGAAEAGDVGEDGKPSKKGGELIYLVIMLGNKLIGM